jgi:hypothetical protein
MSGIEVSAIPDRALGTAVCEPVTLTTSPYASGAFTQGIADHQRVTWSA